MTDEKKLNWLLDKLIADGEKLVATVHRSGAFVPTFEPDLLPALRKWSNELILFANMAGDLIRPWGNSLQYDGETLIASWVENPLSILQTIRFALNEGLLLRYEELIVADAFADLSGQARYLFSQGYFLAAGVISRAVLEEKLRRMSAHHSCVPSKDRPTVNDFNQALYAAKIYDKSMMLHIQAIAAIGNDAAHAAPHLKSGDVERLMNGLEDCLIRFGT